MRYPWGARRVLFWFRCVYIVGILTESRQLASMRSITLLIRALMMKKIQKAGISISINRAQEKLSKIREVLNNFS